MRSAVEYARGSSGRGSGRRYSSIRLVYNERLQRVSGVSGVLSDLAGRVRAGVGRRVVVVVTLSVVARVTSRILVCVASVIIVVTVVVVASRGLLRGRIKAMGMCRDDGESACAAAIVGKPHSYPSCPRWRLRQPLPLIKVAESV